MREHVRPCARCAPWPCLVGLVVAAGCSVVTSPGPRDGDEGPLMVTVGEGGTSLEPPEHPDPGGRWVGSFGGLVLCSSEAGAAIALESVRLRSVVRPLWTRVFTRTFDLTAVRDLGPRRRDAYLPFYGALGSPPGFRERYVDGVLPGRYRSGVAGLRVSQTCHESADTERALTVGEQPVAPLQELVVSLGVGPGGAEVDGLDVLYRVGHLEREVSVDWTMVACGDRVESRDVCS